MKVEDVLGPGGLVAARLGDDFESRPEQLEMARAVARTMEQKSHLLVEAGTGVGKSFAYLVPAILRCIARGERVVIATNTISLQEQLIAKDVPLLKDIIETALGLRSSDEDDPAEPEDSFEDQEPAGPAKLRPVLVKGRGNYVSIRRLMLASQRQDKLFADAASRRSLHVIEDWARETLDGTLSTLPQVERMGVWDKVQSDSGNCMGRKCPEYARCFYQSARRQMEAGNLLICNHALFFSDLALRSQDAGFLPTYQHVIFDEAHNAEDVASDHFGVSLSEGRVAHLLSTLHQPRGGKGFLVHLLLGTQDQPGVEKCMALVAQAADASRLFFEDLEHLLTRSAGGDWAARQGKSDGRTLRIREPGAITNVLTPAMRELALRLKSLKETARTDADRYELNAYAIRAELIAEHAATLCGQTLPGCAYWVEASSAADDGGPSRRRITFACSPIEVGPILKDRLFSGGQSVILTSATLATRTVDRTEQRERAETAFSHILSRLGCEGAQTMQLGSPFDYARQVRLFLPDPPAPHAEDADTSFPLDDGDRLSPLSREILRHLRATRGGAFVLFTSFSSLNRCASELAGVLAREGLPLLAQGRDGSRTAILDRFRQNDSSVLFGAASFWQGVDVRGRNLRNVIITKLPFDPPDRPLTEAAPNSSAPAAATPSATTPSPAPSSVSSRVSDA